MLGKLRSWKEKCLIVTISLTDQQRVEEKLCKAEVAVPSTTSHEICTIYPKRKRYFKAFPRKTDVRDAALGPACVEICHSGDRLILNHLSNSAGLILALSYLFVRLLWWVVTCIMVVCSLIHWWREEASSLNCSNFFCASASKRGWPGGGSAMKIWILRNVGDSFTWEHVIQLGDIRNDRLLVRFGGIDI